MNIFSLLNSVLGDLEEYERSAKGIGTADDFYTWAKASKKPVSDEAAEAAFGQGVGRLVVNIYRYSRHYIRKKLSDDALISFEEFIFLANLNRLGPITKSELIQACIQEKTTGMAVIKRLIEMGYINALKDLGDKRKTVVRLTNTGTELITGYFREMQDIVPIIGGKLNGQEKLQLLQLLQKLDTFHFDIFQNDHGSSVEDIREKYL